eukprot:5918624-Karenia_brevis.AAC.1
MLQDVRDKYVEGCLSALKMKLDWIPLILGDGHMPGSLVLKQYCEKCNAMPIVDGQSFLSERSNGKH